MKEPVCKTCNDTHKMIHTGGMCINCPVPCRLCAEEGKGLFCRNTPCSCECHPPLPNNKFVDWVIGPITSERVGELRFKLAKARGMLVSLINWETEPKDMVPSTQEIKDILKETEDP